MTGVSQATVSVVLNGRSDAEVKIAPETREKVLRAIAETGYVADPIARRLAARDNRIIGVFTYEPVFPSANSDFYHPFLVGIEERAESLGCDLLLLTSSPVVDGRRRIFHQGNRLRLADGCVLLGRSLDRGELARLVADGLPFVSIGRRDDAGGPVPYVGADYAPAVAELVKRAARLGHERLAYFGQGSGPESWRDRFAGFESGCAEAGVTGVHVDPLEDLEDLEALVRQGITAVLAEEHADGVALHLVAVERGVELSIATLGEPTRANPASNVDFDGMRIPRQEMGAQAIDLLTALIEGRSTQIQRLLPCEVVAGTTLKARK